MRSRTGQTLKLSNGSGDKITIELVANFRDYVPNPLPTAPNNVRGSNPFDRRAHRRPTLRH